MLGVPSLEYIKIRLMEKYRMCESVAMQTLKCVSVGRVLEICGEDACFLEKAAIESLHIREERAERAIQAADKRFDEALQIEREAKDELDKAKLYLEWADKRKEEAEKILEFETAGARDKMRMAKVYINFSNNLRLDNDREFMSDLAKIFSGAMTEETKALPCQREATEE